jgi:DNA-binding PadR family transcriptional regulator
VPVLARLEKDALVRASEKGARRSRKFSITAKGTKALTQGWAEQLATERTDLDSILRVVASLGCTVVPGLPRIHEAFRRRLAWLGREPSRRS